ncbi:MAG: aldo/keto reductase [Chloroflexi bacterium]|nr:aldo/keto reductase [Chloroflexota bacterium]
MEYRKLGRSGLDVSVIGLGGNTFGRRCDAAQTASILDAALDVGIQTVDTSDIYGGGGASEEYIGRALTGGKRERWVVMTKFGGRTQDGPNGSGSSRRYIRQQVTASLRRLNTDYIDVYQVHFADRHTPLEETMSALDELVRDGLVRYIGCSNYSPWQLAESQWQARQHGGAAFVSSQPAYNLLNRAVEAEHIPACLHYGVGLIPYSPLAGGFLTGKYRAGEAAPSGSRYGDPAIARFAERMLTEENYTQVAALQRFAEERGLSMLQLALGWLAAQPVVSTVIAGATSPEQVQANAACAEVVLSADDLAALDEVTAGA